jgi:hypothetical protein
MNIDGTDVTQLTDSSGEWFPAISPDGKWMAFTAFDENDVRNIYKTQLGATAPLSVSINPLSATISLGNSLTFTSTVSGGTPPYGHQWYLGGNPVSGATSTSWTFTPTASGIYYVYLKVTDSGSNAIQSETAHITVISAPVGGYSFSIEGHLSAKPLTLYLTLIAVMAIGFILVKRKTIREQSSAYDRIAKGSAD